MATITLYGLLSGVNTSPGVGDTSVLGSLRLELSIGGPMMKANLGPPVAIEHRNATDNAFVVARAADPSSGVGSGSNSDLTTKEYDDRNFVKSFLLMGS
jgi:hypothetical protein